MNLEEFMKRVEPDTNGGCWFWSGAPGAGGYGVLWFEGRYQKAHRVSWALHNGFMPDRSVKVCHKCDVPACVNPDHLWLGSQADNVADMVRKGRGRCGEPMVGSRNPMSALTEEQVSEIRLLLLIGAHTQAEIARSYGVSPMTLSRIANFQTWPHVDRHWPNKGDGYVCHA